MKPGLERQKFENKKETPINLPYSKRNIPSQLQSSPLLENFSLRICKQNFSKIFSKRLKFRKIVQNMKILFQNFSQRESFNFCLNSTLLKNIKNSNTTQFGKKNLKSLVLSKTKEILASKIFT